MPQYLDRKTGKWFAKFRWTDYTGLRKDKKKCGFRTKHEAAEFERNFLGNSNEGGNIKLSSLLDEYHDFQQRHLGSLGSLKVFERTRKYIDIHFQGFLSRPIREITSLAIIGFADYLMSQGLKPATVRTYYNNMRRVFTFAVKHYGFKRDILDRATMPRMPRSLEQSNQEIEDSKFLTRDEFIELMRREKNDDFRLVYELLFWTGARRGEIMGLRVCDIDMEHSIIKIRQSRGVYGTGPTKNQKSMRDILVPEHTFQKLKERVNGLYKPKPNQLIFQGDVNNLSSRFRSLQARTGNSKICKLHSLRHSHCAMLIQEGFPLPAIAERLGHSDISMIQQIYGHIYPKKRQDMVDRLSQLEILDKKEDSKQNNY